MTWTTQRASDTIAHAIRSARIASGIRLRDLQTLTGITYSHLCRIERGDRSVPSVQKLDAIAKAIGLDPLRLRAIALADGLSQEDRQRLASLLIA